MTEERFKRNIEGLVSLKEEPFKDVQELSDELVDRMESFYESDTHEIAWDQRMKDIKYLKETITLDMVKQTYQEMFLNEKTKKMTIVRVFPPKHYDKIEKDEFDEMFIQK